MFNAQNPDPSVIDTRLSSRSVSFENPTGEPGAGGRAANGRKGSPNIVFAPGQVVTLADIRGPGTLRHWWLTVPPMAPEIMRAIRLQVFYDGAEQASIDVPALDFFGATLGRPSAMATALTTVQEARGFNAYFPMPFEQSVRVVLSNESAAAFPLYYQIDYTLDDSEQTREPSYLHVEYRRQNPTQPKQDFVISSGLRGPGRFLGCVVGIRVNQDGVFSWYGEGELKIYLDGDEDYPTICGTGLEDYVGTAWGMGVEQTPYQGVPLAIYNPDGGSTMPDFTSFYRWHVPDPVIFREQLTVTLQQIGAIHIPGDQPEIKAAVEASHELAGNGWVGEGSPMLWGIAERSDDYCAAAFVYCREVQAVRHYRAEEAVADIGRLSYESPSDFEQHMAALGASVTEVVAQE
jgi:hypothetical protein